MARKQKLTELEGCVLAVIRARGPCTPYSVRKEFQSSSTPYWSGSAGAIYPLVRRLERRRLIQPVRAISDGRGGRLYALTIAGRRSLQKWLSPPLSDLTVGSQPDPIRTRVGFLQLLSPKSRQAFLEDAKVRLQHHLQCLTAQGTSKSADPFEQFAQRGSFLVMQARLAWLTEMADALQKPASFDGKGS